LYFTKPKLLYICKFGGWKVLKINDLDWIKNYSILLCLFNLKLHCLKLRIKVIILIFMILKSSQQKMYKEMHMKKTLLTVLMSSSVIFLTACGSGDGDSVFNGPDNGIPVNNIQNPVVSTPVPYTASSIAAGESVVMTYKMLGVNGKEVQATSLVITPKTPAPAKGWPIVVWAHGTTGVADQCAPSRSKLNSNIEVMIAQLLSAGYVVVAPDYEGLGEPSGNELHPFLNLKSEAYSITDAVVAARNYLGVKVSNQWMAVGHSQGGHAALGAAQYASRASNLVYKGTVALAPASNLPLVLAGGESAAGKETDLNKKITALASLDTFTALITAGLRNPNPSLQYSQIFKSPTDNIAKNAEVDCYDVLGQKFGKGMKDYATINGSVDNYPRTQTDFMSIPVVKTFLEKGSQPLQVKVSTPVIIYQGSLDTTVPKQVTDILYSSAIKQNTSIRYLTDESGATKWDHGTVYVLNIPNIIADVKSLMPIQ
jgi:dienelactone hydrolase